MSSRSAESDARTTARKPWILNDPNEETVMFLKEWRYGDERLKLYGRNVVRKKVAETYDRYVVESGHFYVLEYPSKKMLRSDAGVEDFSLELTPEQAQIWLLDHILGKPMARGARLNSYFIGGWIFAVLIPYAFNLFVTVFR